MDADEHLKLECTVAAMLAAGSVGAMAGGASAILMWQRYREMMTLLRNNNGPILADIIRQH
jgi:hypothetical protein